MENFPTAQEALAKTNLSKEKISDIAALHYIEEIQRAIMRHIDQGLYKFEWEIPINLCSLSLSKINKFLRDKKYYTDVISKITFGEDGEYTGKFLYIDWFGSK